MYITLLWWGGGGGGERWCTFCCSFQRDGLVIFGRMEFASYEGNLGGGLLVYPILLFSPSPMMTELLLTGTLIVNSINQSIIYILLITVLKIK